METRAPESPPRRQQQPSFDQWWSSPEVRLWRAGGPHDWDIAYAAWHARDAEADALRAADAAPTATTAGAAHVLASFWKWYRDEWGNTTGRAPGETSAAYLAGWIAARAEASDAERAAAGGGGGGRGEGR